MKALPLAALQAGAGLGSQGVRSRPMLYPSWLRSVRPEGWGWRAVVSGSRVALVPGLAPCSHFRALRALSALDLGPVTGVVSA